MTQATHAPVVTVRFGSPQDTAELERLAALESKRVPAGPTVVAEVDGHLIAALPVSRGEALSDPLRSSDELVEVLELRVSQMRGRGRRRRWRRR